MPKKFFRKDWILYEELANDDGEKPKELEELKFKTDDPDKDRHVPFIEETPEGYRVRTGKAAYHSVTLEHHTLYVELWVDEKLQLRHYFKFGEVPDVNFLAPKGKKVEAFTFCNLHGLWKYTLGQANPVAQTAK